MKRPAVLIILDGYGIDEREDYNAIAKAKKPNLDFLTKTYPYQKGYASGLAVGLPDGQMGNSEVGHMNMGAGRIIYQELTRITKEIDDGDFFSNKELLSAIENCKKNNSNLHIFGLLSDGGVHSHNTHMYALLKLAKNEGFDRVFLHCFLDGRDTPPKSGRDFVEEAVNKMNEIGVGKVATVMGRYYAMDRDNRWDRVKKAYDAMLGIGNKALDPVMAIENSYGADVTDEFVVPTYIEKDGKPLTTVKDGDSIIFYNFRPDRAREISKCFCLDDFDGFERGERIKTKFICFTDYDVTMPNKEVAFKKVSIKNTFGEYISNLGMKQLRIAETEKYAHVTFFFNGGVEEKYPGEDRILVKSPKVATYDLQPEMSAPEVCIKLCEAIRSEKYDAIICNFANPDMVGHTGIMEAAVKAVEAVDICIGKIFEEIKKVGGFMFICADHGNAEQMVDYVTGESFTAHTINPVPFILANAGDGIELRENGRLCDIIPTMLEIMGLEQPKEMTGESLIIKNA